MEEKQTIWHSAAYLLTESCRQDVAFPWMHFSFSWQGSHINWDMLARINIWPRFNPLATQCSLTAALHCLFIYTEHSAWLLISLELEPSFKILGCFCIGVGNMCWWVQGMTIAHTPSIPLTFQAEHSSSSPLFLHIWKAPIHQSFPIKLKRASQRINCYLNTSEGWWSPHKFQC